MLKIKYITRVRVLSKDAQSRQILCMSTAFQSILGERFMLCSGGINQDLPFAHKSIAPESQHWVRYLFACWEAAWTTLSKEAEQIVTRDIAVAFVAVRLGGRALYEAHDVPHHWVTRRMIRSLVKSPHFQIVTNCAALADFYEEQYPAAKERIMSQHNGCFAEDYQPLLATPKNVYRAELGLPLDKTLVIHTGSLYKGGAELFEYVARVDSERIFVVHVGGHSEECAVWQRYFLQRGIGNIMLIPHQSSQLIGKYQRAADMLFYVSTRKSPIWWCTSPLKVFEYMASGTPIIGTRLGSLSELFSEDNAFLYDPDQPESVSRAVAHCYSLPDESSKRAAVALAQAEYQYSWYSRARAIARFMGLS